MSTTVWLTYAWTDNKHGDVDFIAQELGACGLTVKLDRWNLSAGKRLWDQIDQFICNRSQSDAWLLLATPASLSSEACREEYAYALDRALHTRGDGFPVIAVFPAHVDEHLVPAGVRTRLHVSLTDPDWKERIKSAAEGRTPSVARPIVEPFALNVHQGHPSGKVVVEVRPRAGVWSPVFAAVPIAEHEASEPWVFVEPSGLVTGSGMVVPLLNGPSTDGAWWVASIQGQATPTMSLYVWCKVLPSRLAFGATGHGPNYQMSLQSERAA